MTINLEIFQRISPDFLHKLLGRCLVGLLSLENCCGRPKIRNSVLEGLRRRKLKDIHVSYSVLKVSAKREIQSILSMPIGNLQDTPIR